MGKDPGSTWAKIQDQLREQGIDLETICSGAEGGTKGDRPLKVVCVASTLQDTVEEMGRSPRDQVVMVRVDEETARKLDDWVETGAVKSRSEAAALFIREGLKVREGELSKLRDALRDVEQARDRLREQAADVFGTGAE